MFAARGIAVSFSILLSAGCRLLLLPLWARVWAHSEPYPDGIVPTCCSAYGCCPWRSPLAVTWHLHGAVVYASPAPRAARRDPVGFGA